MANYSISGELFKKMVTNGAVNLKNNHKEIDHLNVFPVPDGDTGTNMQMTMMTGIRELENKEDNSIVDISKILSRGLLMGARGNSGVILSQFFRGVYTEIAKINNGNATVKEFIQALVGGYQMAYRAVMDPVEGTILTVVRESAERVLQEEANLNSIEEVMELYTRQAHETLARTPELLPVLKEAGVVDSGGAGFIKIIEGMQMALQGQILAETEVSMQAQPTLDFHTENHALESLQDIKFAFCTEFIVKLFDPEKFNDVQIKKPLSQMGDSLVVVVMDDLLKVHVHTNQPGVALTLAQKYGELQTIKIDNMKLQHNQMVSNYEAPSHKTSHVAEKEKSKYAVIAVASGEGIKNTFTELGVEYIIDGGQTMNPSAEDFVQAVEAINADNIIIIPNNSNIILTAEQTIDLMPDKTIRVLKTKTISQGYASLMVFDQTRELDDNIEDMMEAALEVKSGEVTYAVRDTSVNGISIKKDDYIGILGNQIVVSTKSRYNTTKQLITEMLDETAEIVTIFYGKDTKESEVDKLVEHIEKINPDVEVDVIQGDQEIYSYIIAVE